MRYRRRDIEDEEDDDEEEEDEEKFNVEHVRWHTHIHIE